MAHVVKVVVVMLRSWACMQVLGTGLEDFWDSSSGFSLINGKPPLPSTDTDGEVRRCEMHKGQDTLCEVEGAPFQDSSAGVLHFSSVFPPGHQPWSLQLVPFLCGSALSDLWSSPGEERTTRRV